jgi:hypothetical protein
MRYYLRPFLMQIAVLGTALLAGAAHPPLALAGNFSFTSRGDNTSWDDPRNWDPNGVPASADDVTIRQTPDGPSHVILKHAVTLHSLVLGPGGFLGGNDITITSSLTWQGGAFQGHVILPPTSVTLVSGPDDKGLYSGGVIDNAGMFTFAGGTMWFSHTAALNNTSTLVARPGVAFSSGECCNEPAVITNTGLFVVQRAPLAPAPGIVTVANVGFNASGTVEVQSGSLLDLQIGPSTFAPGVKFRGGGRARIEYSEARDVTVQGPVNINSASTVELADGAGLAGTGTITGGAFDWTGGQITGVITIAPDTSLLIDGPKDKYLSVLVQPASGLLINKGTATFTGTGRLGLGGPAVLNNAGRFTAKAGATFFSSCCFTLATINNTGTFVSDPGPGGTVTLSGVALLNRAGSLSIKSGTLQANIAGYQQIAGTTILDGATLASDRPVVIQGGELRGVGTVDATLANSGILGPGPLAPANASGILKVTKSYTQTAAGALQININGLKAGTDYDQLSVIGAVVLAGTLAIVTPDTFHPAVGARFDVITTTKGLLLSNPLAATGTTFPVNGEYSVQYTDAGVRLLVDPHIRITLDPSPPDGRYVIDVVPTLPQIQARAQVVNITPDPTASTTFTWTVGLRIHKNDPSTCPSPTPVPQEIIFDPAIKQNIETRGNELFSVQFANAGEFRGGSLTLVSES